MKLTKTSDDEKQTNQEMQRFMEAENPWKLEGSDFFMQEKEEYMRRALELARNHLGIVFAPDKSVQSDLQDGTLVPCFQHPYEWWLDLVAIFRKREYQPWRVQYVLDEMLREIRHQLAQSQQLRPEQAAESED